MDSNEFYSVLLEPRYLKQKKNNNLTTVSKKMLIMSLVIYEMYIIVCVPPASNLKGQIQHSLSHHEQTLS